MGDIKRFATVNTKIKALDALLLNKKDYELLVDMEEPEDIVMYLKEMTAYSSILEEENESRVDIKNIEGLLKCDVIEKFERLSHYYTDAYKKFYKAIFTRYEIEDVKLLLRMLIRKEKMKDLENHISQTKYHQLDIKTLSKVESIEEFIDGLKGSPYYNLLRYYLEEDSDKMMFYMEMSLDHYYFKKLYKTIERFATEDRELMEESIGRNIDVQNLQWIYRGLKYYGLSPEELLNYTLNAGYHLKFKDLKVLCYTEDMTLLAERIRATKYGDLFSDAGQGTLFYELNMERYLLNLMKKLQKEHPMTILETVVYMHKKEYEVRDIFTLLESKRYHAPIEDVKKFLVHKVH